MRYIIYSVKAHKHTKTIQHLKQEADKEMRKLFNFHKSPNTNPIPSKQDEFYTTVNHAKQDQLIMNRTRVLEMNAYSQVG